MSYFHLHVDVYGIKFCRKRCNNIVVYIFEVVMNLKELFKIKHRYSKAKQNYTLLFLRKINHFDLEVQLQS
jgi:hypothetical protein